VRKFQIKKSSGHIIRDDVRRKKLRGAGLAIFFFSILLLLGVTHFYPRGGEAAGVFGLTSLGVALAGFVMFFASLKCPICDSVIYKSGACKCQPNSAGRSAHIDRLKKTAAGPDWGGGA
jgi:hypothetical protein